MAPEAGIDFDAATTPEGMRLYAVGDIHGCYDLMMEMHRRIMAEILRDRPDDWRIVYLGDYIDRGPGSRQVLEFLCRTIEADPRVIALGGNHDLGLLEFLMLPSAESLFANHGGPATARSYGVHIDFHPHEALMRGHAALREAIPEEHVAFLRGLELCASFGDFYFCHAGIRPAFPL